MAKKGKHFRAVDEARAAGYRVHIQHSRVDSFYPGEFNPLPVSGWTSVILFEDVGDRENHEERSVAVGLAYCSWKDNFSRRIGAQIACGRALKQAQGR